MFRCPHCEQPYEPGDVDTTLGVAHCRACDRVSELRARTRPEDRAPVPMPSSSGWEEVSSTPLRLEKPWRDAGTLFLVFFTLVWNGFLCFGFGGGLSGDPAALLGMLCLPHSWLGMGLAYYVVAQLLNRTTVSVADHHLRVRVGPLPWFRGTLELPVSKVDQIYVEESNIRVNKQPRWNVCVMDQAGVGRVLVGMVASQDEGRWLEDRLERAMAIEDRPVAGEVHK